MERCKSRGHDDSERERGGEGDKMSERERESGRGGQNVRERERERKG